MPHLRALAYKLVVLKKLRCARYSMEEQLDGCWAVEGILA